MRRLSLIFAILVIGAAGAITLGAYRRTVASEQSHRDLLADIPHSWPGWTARDLPVADTPEMKRAVKEMLNYDGAVLREFRQGKRQLLIYAAYWRSGRFHPRLISQHTPENCWVGNGMTMTAAHYGTPVNLGAWTTWPGQYLSFTTGGQAVNVIYWHIQNGAPSGYASGPTSASRTFTQNVLRDLKDGIGEQYFIRISGTEGLEDWERERLFAAMLESFRPVLATH